MRRKNRIVLAAFLLLGFSGAAAAQTRLEHLKSWEGKYPTDRKGRVTTKFFGLPEIRTPLLALLSKADFGLLTNTYAVETPIKKIGDYLTVKMCRPHSCDEQGAFAIDLNTGAIHVRMQANEKARWFHSKGSASSLPAEVKSYMEDFSAT
jgi:hypothetical protein